MPRKRSSAAIVSKRGRKPTRGKNKPRSLTSYKRALDAIFSKYIRARDKNTCYTCGRVSEKGMQNGHFVPRQYLSLRWDEKNNHAQCYACNMLYNGQPGAYALHLVLDYGRDIIEELESHRKDLTKLTPEWYIAQIALYKQKLADL